jgi:hypothetical protein
VASASNDKEKTPSEEDHHDPKLKEARTDGWRIKGKRTYF